MSEAAHPQHDPDANAKKLHAANGPRGEDHDKAWDDTPEATREVYREMAGGGPVKNPFPPSMTVPGVAGQQVTVELAVVDGVVYAPMLDDLPVSPQVRQYVTQYCAAWSTSVVTTGKLDAQWPEFPRRGVLTFEETQLHAMLGLAPDERLHRIVVDQVTNRVSFVVESPRLPREQYPNSGPPHITMPVAAWYEQTGAQQ